MNPSHIQKEELLTMLTGIYDQLEELEKTLESNLSDLRNNMIQEQTVKVSTCEEKLMKLESKLDEKDSKALDIVRSKQHIGGQTNMKLELGF